MDTTEAVIDANRSCRGIDHTVVGLGRRHATGTERVSALVGKPSSAPGQSAGKGRDQQERK